MSSKTTPSPKTKSAAKTGRKKPHGPAPARRPRSPASGEAIGPRSAPGAGADPKGKLGVLVGLLRRPQGATIQDLAEATGWQAHSVRGAIAGALKKDRGLNVTSAKTEGGRVYRIDGATA